MSGYPTISILDANCLTASGGGLSPAMESMANGICPAKDSFARQMPKGDQGVPIYCISDQTLNVPTKIRKMDRSSVLAFAAAQPLFPMIQSLLPIIGKHNLGIFHATSRGPVLKTFEAFEMWKNDRNRPNLAVDLPLASTAGLLSGHLKTTGPSLTVSATCCSGGHALVEAANAIQYGHLQAALVVASEAAIHPSVLGQMQLAGMLAKYSNNPNRGCIPFDLERTGTCLGEGAAAVLVCNSKLQVPFKPIARLAGWDASTDPYSRTLSHPAGATVLDSIARSLKMAALKPGNLSCISPHGTGTVFNDNLEKAAIEKLFQGAPIQQYPLVLPTKHYTGHCLGATSLIEVCFILSLLSSGNAEPAIPSLDYLKNPIINQKFFEPNQRGFTSALSISLGFWGNINSLVFIK